MGRGDIEKIHSHLKNISTSVKRIKSYAILTLDMEGSVSSWNEGASDVTGYKKQEAFDKHIGFLYLPEDKDKDKPAENLTYALEHSTYEAEDYLVKKTGEVFLADITISQIDDTETDGPIGFIMVVKDITKRRQQETDQIDANSLLKQEIGRRKVIEKALKESNAELDAFAAAASHDLQEPLRMVISYLQLIDRRYRKLFDKDGKEFLEFAVDGATRMRALISDLVEYARIDTVVKPFKKIDTNELVTQVLNNLQLSAEDAGVKVTRDDLPEIWGDAVQLGQVFQNLIANAIKFCDKNTPKVHIGVRATDGEYEFRIEDNGKGIAKKDYDTIFLIFKQLGTRSQRQGSGVGLSIVKKIVIRHYGRIWVESEEGEGSTFYFTLPNQNLKTKEGLDA
jgi:PAS domain S-box-containing protein